MSIELDPVKYEVFVKRLGSVLEEGREAVAMISGSPAIVEGGEFMTSLYEGDGRGILTAAGTLFHVMGSAPPTLSDMPLKSMRTTRVFMRAISFFIMTLS